MHNGPRQTKISAFFKTGNAELSQPRFSEEPLKDHAIGSVPSLSARPNGQDERILQWVSNVSSSGTPEEDPSLQQQGVVSAVHDTSESPSLQDRSVGESGSSTAVYGQTQATMTPQQADQSQTPNTAAMDITPPAPSDRFTIHRIAGSDLSDFKRILNTLLPVTYPQSFFNNIENTHSALARIAFWHNQPGRSGSVVGGIKCRLERIPGLVGPSGKLSPESQMYIQTIGVLSPYRRYSIAQHLLHEVLKEAAAASASHPADVGVITSVYAHVWEANEDALEWYKKRGFATEEFIGHYYTKLQPRGAWVVRKQLKGMPSDC